MIHDLMDSMGWMMTGKDLVWLLGVAAFVLHRSNESKPTPKSINSSGIRSTRI